MGPGRPRFPPADLAKVRLLPFAILDLRRGVANQVGEDVCAIAGGAAANLCGREARSFTQSDSENLLMRRAASVPRVDRVTLDR